MKLILLFLFFISTAYAGHWDCATTTNTGTFIKSNDCTIFPNNHVEVTNTLEIIGKNNGSDTDMSNLVTITAATNQRHFYVNGENATLTLSYIKLVGGDVREHDSLNWGGSIFIDDNGGELNLYSSIVFNNKAVFGGGIYAYGDSNTNKNDRIMNIDNSIIHNNTATYGDGGGIYMRNAVAIIENTTIDYNQAPGNSGFGGGMSIVSSAVTMKNTNISNNKAGDRGGGLYIRGDSTTVTLRQTSFIDNDATYQGDAIRTYESPTISLINTYFNNPNDDNNIVESPFGGTPTWKTCRTTNSPCDVGETCSEDSNLPNKAVRCEAVFQQCVINIEITGTCTDDQRKQKIKDKYKQISCNN